MGETTGDAETTQPVMLPIADIKTELQVRAALDEPTVQDYAEKMAEGVPLPPAIVYRDAEGNLWLAAGFHRREARLRNGEAEILADVWVGSRREAKLKAIESNAQHGLPYTPADKRRAVEILLRDSEWSTWSDRAISRQTGASPSTVADVRQQVAVSIQIGQIEGQGANTSPGPPAASTERTATRGGTTYPMKTGAIGKAKGNGKPAKVEVEVVTTSTPAPVAEPAGVEPDGDGALRGRIGMSDPTVWGEKARWRNEFTPDAKLTNLVENLEAWREPMRQNDFQIPLADRLLESVQDIDAWSFFFLIYCMISSFGERHHLGAIYYQMECLDDESFDCLTRYVEQAKERRQAHAREQESPEHGPNPSRQQRRAEGRRLAKTGT